MNGDNHFELQQTTEHICVKFNTEHPVLSSAVYNGGYNDISNILIMRVEENFDGRKKTAQNPAVSLAEYCKHLQLNGTTAGTAIGVKANNSGAITV